MKFYPLQFEPIFKERIWGGQKLREYFGKDIPPFAKIGESWELADLDNGKSIISNGSFAGRTLASVVERYSKQITGRDSFTQPFPLLIKILDAEDVLSVQVHPDKQTCQRRGKGDPKTECWYVISADPGAVIYKGLKSGVTRERFAEAIRAGDVDELLERIEVAAGECHFLPAGTAHAIGAGLLIAEIQTPSDTTYRVFDWNRVDEKGMGRELHIEDALESIHFGAGEDDLSVRTVGRLVDSDFFKVDKGHRTAGGELFLARGMMRVFIFLSGRGRIVDADNEEVDFASGRTILIPAVYEGAVEFSEESEYLVVTVG